MNSFINWIRKELIFYIEFFPYNGPRVRIGWVWIFIAFFFFGYFSYLLCGIVTIAAIYNFINRSR
jgi:hypothetical protein